MCAAPPPKTAIRKLLGRSVRAAREYRGLSQRDLCNQAGMSQAYVSKCESGKFNIGVDNIARIAREMGLQPHELLDPDFKRHIKRSR